MRTTIVAVCAAILVVFAVVIGINWKQVSGGKGQTETTTAAALQDESETDDMVGMVIDMSQTPTAYGIQIGNDLKAFERDESFFDPRQTTMEELMETASKRLSLMVTSVERDLRVYVVDILGNRLPVSPSW